MENLPNELFIEFLFSIDDLNSLKQFCKINKRARELCKRYRHLICKKFLQRYQVDYNDPNNFIYVMNQEKKDNFFKDNVPDYCRLLGLYSKFYDKKTIMCKFGNAGRTITSMPLYPNIEQLICDDNQLVTLPDGMKNLNHLDCSSNRLISLPKGMVKLTSLACDFNNLESLPDDLFSLEWLICHNNKFKTLPNVVFNLKMLFCGYNLLESLPKGMTSLNSLSCTHNLLTSLPDDMINLRNLDCSHNRLTALPLTFSKLKNLECNGNQFSSEHLNGVNERNGQIAYQKYVAEQQ